MSKDREKPSTAKESVARTTAREVPFMRGDDSEAAPHGQRPAHLPRDPTYEAELADVELAVLRDPEKRDDPSTKQAGKRLAAAMAAGNGPESVTPESPATRVLPDVVVVSPKPPSSGGRAVASGTLLSVGAVDPRGKTERTLETPRMFFSQAELAGEAYFKPGKIPAVTVHQTLETETVKLSDSVDPRRAKTLPRIDRQQLERFAAAQGHPFPDEPASDAPVALSEPQPSSLNAGPVTPHWNQAEYDPVSSLGEQGLEGQIHASLSPFRERSPESPPAEPSYGFEAVPTRAEPLAARRRSDMPPPSSLPSAPETNQIPTHRDLPVHRIEASQPPPAPSSSEAVTLLAMESARLPPPPSAPNLAHDSEGPRPTTASISIEEPTRKSTLVNYAAFVVALLLAVALGLWLTSGSEPQQAAPLPTTETPRVTAPLVEVTPAPPTAQPALTPPAANVVAPSVPTIAKTPPAPPPRAITTPNTKPAPPKTTRETIF